LRIRLLRLEVDRLRIEPLLPAAWTGFDVHYRYRETVFHIHQVDVELACSAAAPRRDLRSSPAAAKPRIERPIRSAASNVLSAPAG